MCQQLVSTWYSSATNFIITNNLECVPYSLFCCSCSILKFYIFCPGLQILMFNFILLPDFPLVTLSCRALTNWSSCPGSCLNLSECFYHPLLALSSVLRRWRWESRRYPYLKSCHTLFLSLPRPHGFQLPFHLLCSSLMSIFLFCTPVSWPKDKG